MAEQHWSQVPGGWGPIFRTTVRKPALGPHAYILQGVLFSDGLHQSFPTSYVDSKSPTKGLLSMNGCQIIISMGGCEPGTFYSLTLLMPWTVFFLRILLLSELSEWVFHSSPHTLHFLLINCLLFLLWWDPACGIYFVCRIYSLHLRGYFIKQSSYTLIDI